VRFVCNDLKQTWQVRWLSCYVCEGGGGHRCAKTVFVHSQVSCLQISFLAKLLSLHLSLLEGSLQRNLLALRMQRNLPQRKGLQQPLVLQTLLKILFGLFVNTGTLQVPNHLAAPKLRGCTAKPIIRSGPSTSWTQTGALMKSKSKLGVLARKL
jgi:hypothetical protein